MGIEHDWHGSEGPTCAVKTPSFVATINILPHVTNTWMMSQRERELDRRRLISVKFLPMGLTISTFYNTSTDHKSHESSGS